MLKTVYEYEKKDELVRKFDYIIRENVKSLTNEMPPRSFKPQSPENILTHIDMSFGKICSTLEEKGVKNPHTLSLFHFYNRIEYFESKKTQTVSEPEID